MHFLTFISGLFCFSVAFCSTAEAFTFERVEITCPIDGEKFSFLRTSSSHTLVYLLDHSGFPPSGTLWRLPVCPASRFVIYRDDFTSNELEKLQSFVASPEWGALKEESDYFRASMTMKHMGEDPTRVAYMLLKATWGTEDCSQYLRYAKKALDAFRALSDEKLAGAKRINSAQTMDQEFVAGELERRLGLLDEAEKRFKRLSKVKSLENAYQRKIIDLQLKLVGEGNTQPHVAP